MSEEQSDPSPSAPADPTTVQVPPRKGGALGPVLVVLALVLVGTLIAVTGLGRAVTAAPIPLTALVTVLPYLYAALLAVLFGLWALAPDRKVLPGLLATVLVLGAVLWGPAIASRGETSAGLPVKVASWNVRRLWGGPEGDEPLTCVQEVLADIDADVISLQEVSARDVATLSQALDLECVHTDYLGRGDPTDGGLAACVRRGAWKLHSGQAARFVPGHRWHYVFAEFEREGRIFNLLAVHLQPYRLAAGGLAQAADVPERQGDQSAELLRRVGRFKDPTVLAGDFNSTRDAALHVALRSPLTDAFERGGSGLGASFHLFGWLPIRIDYIYVTDTFAVQESRIVPRDCSDHRPIVTDLVLRE